MQLAFQRGDLGGGIDDAHQQLLACRVGGGRAGGGAVGAAHCTGGRNRGTRRGQFRVLVGVTLAQDYQALLRLGCRCGATSDGSTGGHLG